jgi:hypothetical protein
MPPERVLIVHIIAYSSNELIELIESDSMSIIIQH